MRIIEQEAVEMLNGYLVLGLSVLPVFIVFFIFIILASKRPLAFLLTSLIYFAITASTAPWFNFKLGTTVAGFHFYPEDLITISALIGLVFTKSAERAVALDARIRKIKFAASCLLLGIFTGVLFWTLTYGIKIGVNSWRELLLEVALLRYSLLKNFHWNMHHLTLLTVVPGGLLSVVTLIRFATVGIGRSDGVDPLTGEQLGRATNSLGAYFLLLAFLGSFYLLKSRIYLRISIMFITSVELLLLQQRTVWVCGLAGFIGFLSLRTGKEVKTSRVSKLFLLPPLAVVSWFVFSKNSFIQNAATDTNTLNWRLHRWKESMTTGRTIVEWIFGSIFGPTPVTTYGLHSEFSHDAYVNQIELLGFLGVGILIFLIFISFRGSSSEFSVGNLGKLFVLTVMVYGFTYQIPIVFYILAPVMLTVIRDVSLPLNLKSFSQKKSKIYSPGIGKHV